MHVLGSVVDPARPRTAPYATWSTILRRMAMRGLGHVVGGLLQAQPKVHARNFEIAEGRKSPRRVRRLGTEVTEAIFAFETDAGRCHGILRLPVDTPGRAWVFSSSLSEIKGYEEPIGDRRPAGAAYSRNFGGDNWADLRAREQAFEDREPAVVIMGGSQFGVTLAARLRLLGVDTLVVERTPRIGDVWRNRYSFCSSMVRYIKS